MGFPRPGESTQGRRALTIKVGLLVFALLVLGVWFTSFRDTQNRKEQIKTFTDDKYEMAEKVTVLHESEPRVLLWKDFLNEDECQEIIDYALPGVVRSMVASHDKLKENAPLSVADPVRTSSGSWISRTSTLAAVKKFTQRISLWSGLSTVNGEDIQFLEYKPEQYYKPHHDYFDPAYYSSFLENGGQRRASILCFLNDVEEGGETIFPLVGLEVKPTKGSAILWFNTHQNGTLDPFSLHGGNSVIKGLKYVAIQWMRETART